MTEFKEGDQLRVTMEVEYVGETDTWLDVKGTAIEKKFVTSIEKIEPPVEAFGPGDVVRSVHKFPAGNLYAITDRGFVRLSGSGWTGAPNGTEVAFDTSEFTSEHYEKVTLG